LAAILIFAITYLVIAIGAPLSAMTILSGAAWISWRIK